MTTIILLVILIVLWFLDFVKWIISRKEMKKNQIKYDFRHTEMLEAWSRVEIAFKNSKVDVVDRNSIKRHIATLLNRLDEVEQSLEPFKPFIVDGDHLDLDALAEQIRNQQAIVLPESDWKQKTIDELHKLVDIQGLDGNWDYDEYMCGMYNGMELMLATVENREPVYKSKQSEG